MKDADEMRIFCSDLKRLLYRFLPNIKSVALICGSATFVYLLMQPPLFLAEATFKQGDSVRGRGAQLEDLFQAFGGLSVQERGVIGTMTSQGLLHDVIAHLGMQVKWNPSGRFKTFFERIWNNMNIEMGRPQMSADGFLFRDVFYDEEAAKTLWIKMLSDAHFQLLDEHQQNLGKWALHESIDLPFFKGSLVQVPIATQTNKCYRLELLPWRDVVLDIKRRFAIKPVKLDNSLFKLYFTDRNRQLASDFLNAAMSCYQEHVHQDNEQIASAQLSYLEKRQQELSSQWDGALQDHVAYVKSNLDIGGGFGFEQELAHLQGPQQAYSSRLLEIDFELNRMRSQCQNKQKIKNFHLQDPRSDEGIAHDLSVLSQQKNQASLALHELENGKELSCDLSLFNHPKHLVSIWAKQVFSNQAQLCQVSQEERGGLVQKLTEQKKQLGVHLCTLIEQIDLKMKALQENRQLHASKHHELMSLTLPAAQALFVDYNNQRDGLQTQLTQLIHVSEQLYQPHFELSSITTILSDPVTQQLVMQAGEVAVRLQDADNQSIREQEHLKETLINKKKFLAQHLAQVIELTKLRMALAEDKISSLHSTTMTLLTQEKQLLKQQLQHIRQKMEELPEKWRKENVLMLQKEIGMKMVEGVAQLVESKNIDRHLYHVGSKPLDRAWAPKSPKRPYLFLYAALAAVLGALGCYCFYFFASVARGFPVSHDRLNAWGWNSCGVLSSNNTRSVSELMQQDLEVLRRGIQFIMKNRARMREQSHSAGSGLCCVILGKNNAEIPLLLAEMLSMQQLRPLVVQYVFDQKVSVDQVPGLWQYLHTSDEICPIRQYPHYDYLPAGGTSRHGVELLSHPKFKKLLEEAKLQYDVVVLYSSALPADTEGKALCSIADVMMIIVQDEKKEDLTPYQAWGSSDQCEKVAFIPMA